jgi:ABC transport system ATP-binding/permease protein
VETVTNHKPYARLILETGEQMLYPGISARLGRATDNEIVINDANASRYHALIEWTGDRFILRDNNSANGTYVNGQRLGLEPHVLANEDRIEISWQVLVYEIIPVAPDVERPAEVILMGGAQTITGIPTGPYLVVSAGPDLGQEYPLWGEQVLIGRASREATWEIRLTDRSVSRPHARIDKGPEAYILTDLDSANGTQLNGTPVKGQPVTLQDGDEITVGETRLVFHASLAKHF